MDNLYTVILAAVLPPFALVGYVWWKDKYRREPFKQIARGFIYGIVAACFASVIEMLLVVFCWVPTNPTNFFQAVWQGFVGAALPEELIKLLMLRMLLRRNDNYDERFDGIVYAVCIGMGFAAYENIGYLFNNLDNWQSVAVGRAMFAVPGHFLFAVAMGYFLSAAYYGDIDWQKRFRVIWVPVMLHGIYDSLLFISNLSTVWSGIILVCFYVFCIKMLHYGHKRIEEHLERDKKHLFKNSE